MNMGQASNASGVSQKMIRYYESIGLVEGVGRSPNGYRVYVEDGIHTPAFIKRARHLGFSIEQIQPLMALWRDKERSSAEVGATLAQWSLGGAALLSPIAMRVSGTVGGVALVVAGLFQFTPWKEACLSRCRTPLVFVQRHDNPART
jgi:DNA-binding transcriptional MerR regulator